MPTPLQLILKLTNPNPFFAAIMSIPLQLPSKMFYDNALVPCADEMVVKQFERWEGLASPSAGFPVLFEGLMGKDDREGNSPSWFNPDEVWCKDSLVCINQSIN
jgi:hypothetical protein